MKLTMMIIVTLGGGAAGALLGYFGKCTSGACPLTATPLRGSIIGLLIGGLLAVSFFGKPQTGRKTVTTADIDESAIIHIKGQEQFKEKVLQAENPALVDFYADWCGPCRQLAPHIAAIANQNPDLVVAKVDVDADANRSLAKEYRVQGIPYLVLVKNGKTVTTTTGYMNQQKIQEWIDSNTGDQE